MAIYITGDTHGDVDIRKFGAKSLKKNKINFTENDYVIITGDFGLPFTPQDVVDYEHNKGSYNYWIKWLNDFDCTFLFIDGNHDNHEWWKEQATEKVFGGIIQRHPHADNIIHLMRGEVYTIEDKKIFTMGGADSIDKVYRREHISWWKEEMPSKEEYQNAIDNLSKHNFEVDYVVTHDCCGFINYNYFHYSGNELTQFFNRLEFDFNLKFKHWYFGHHHLDKHFDENHTCVYDNIIKIN